MTWIDILMIGIALSADAFAASICRGLVAKEEKIQEGVVTGIFFGVAQGLMPLLGWLLGRSFSQYIQQLDHWIAFVLLGMIGLNMIKDSYKNEETVCRYQRNYKELMTMAIATSIDALAVGVTFAFLQTNIGWGILCIGCITFSLSFVGVWLGAKLGSAIEKYAKLVGGIVLILIGTKILIEHLGVI